MLTMTMNQGGQKANNKKEEIEMKQGKGKIRKKW